jgi:hypothetical protein
MISHTYNKPLGVENLVELWLKLGVTKIMDSDGK